MFTIEHDGDTWRVLGKGAEREGKTLCHLASTTRGRQQKNGWSPVQMCDWIQTETLKEAEKCEQ